MSHVNNVVFVLWQTATYQESEIKSFSFPTLLLLSPWQPATLRGYFFVVEKEAEVELSRVEQVPNSGKSYASEAASEAVLTEALCKNN